MTLTRDFPPVILARMGLLKK